MKAGSRSTLIPNNGTQSSLYDDKPPRKTTEAPTCTRAPPTPDPILARAADDETTWWSERADGALEWLQMRRSSHTGGHQDVTVQMKVVMVLMGLTVLTVQQKHFPLSPSTV